MKKIIFLFVLLCTSLSSFSQVLYTNNFSGGSAGWILGYGGNFDVWIVNNVYNCASTTPNQGGGNYMHIYDDLWYDYCAHSAFLGFGAGGTVYATQNSDISTIGYPNIAISFDWLCQGQTGPVLASYGFIDYSTNSGASWTNITSPFAQYNGQPNWTNVVINSAAMGNQATLRIRFGFTNSGYGTNPAFAVDNVSISVGGPPCANVGGTANASPSSICGGNTSVVTVTASNGTIQWEQSPNGVNSWTNVVGGSGATSANYTTAALSSTLYYRAKLSEPSCPDVYSTVTSVSVSPVVTAGVSIAANPAGAVCEGTSVTFTATPSNGGASPTYAWTLNGSPVATGPVYISSTLTTGDQLVCTMTSNAACVSGSPATSNTITMTVNPNPVATITPPGPISTCSDSAVILYCGPIGTYQWSTGSTAPAETPTQTGNYCVTVTDANGCTDTACVFVTVNPNPIVNISGDNSICEGDNSVLTAAGASTYVWSTSQTINPITVTPASNATYTVTGTDGFGCTGTSTITVAVTTNNIDNSLTSISPITIQANQGSATYQWVDCNNGNAPIAGATNQSFTATSNGSYAVIITQDPCSTLSSCVTINSVGVEEENGLAEISIYPNPSNGTFTISSTIQGNYTLINELGQTLMTIQLNAGNNYAARIESLVNGIYFIVGKDSVRKKILVAK